MANTIYEELNKKFEESYVKKIKERLARQNEYFKKTKLERIASTIGFFIFNIMFLLLAIYVGLFAGPFSGITSQILNFDVGAFLQIYFDHIAIYAIAPLFLIFFISFGVTFYFGLTLKEPYPKKQLMRDFLDIFSEDAKWDKGYIKCQDNKFDEYRQINIFNPFPFGYFDDIIRLEYNGVKILISEFNTTIINFASVYMFLFGSLFGLCFLGIIYVIICLLMACILPFFFFRHVSFRGVVVELEMNKNFQGHTFFLNKSLNSAKIPFDHNLYKSVNLESPKFSKTFNTYSTDQVESRYLLTTAMIDRLENLKVAFHSDYMRGSFKDGKLILAISTKENLFRISGEATLIDYELLKNSFEEMISILQIIDTLKLNEHLGL